MFSDLPAGGWGGTPFNDGMNVTMDPLGNCMNMPAETAELLFPIEYEAFELRCDSRGTGQAPRRAWGNLQGSLQMRCGIEHGNGEDPRRQSGR